jgi:hypothetical protein
MTDVPLSTEDVSEMIVQSVVSRLQEYGIGNSRGRLEHQAARIIIQQYLLMAALRRENDLLARLGGSALRELYDKAAAEAV